MTIRRRPQDFLVDEVLSDQTLARLRPSPTAAARHAVYRLVKTSITTPEAVQHAARALGVRQADISYGGLKDKHARTSQHITIAAHGPRQAGALPSEAAGPGERWSCSRLGWLDEPLAAGAIAGNRFSIVVRDLSDQSSGEMDRRSALLLDPRADPANPVLLVVNYFGDQRFGSARHGQGWVARRLIDGDFEGALKLAIATPARKDAGQTRQFVRAVAAAWEAHGGPERFARLLDDLPRLPERRAVEALARPSADGAIDFRRAFAALPPFLQSMYLEAFQSHLWNAVARGLAGRISERAGMTTPPADARPGVFVPKWRLLRTPDDFGELLFPHAAAVTDDDRALIVPLPARKTQPAPPWGDLLLGVLAEEGISLDDFKVPGLKRPFFGEAPRPLFAAAEGFSLSAPERDDLAPTQARLKREVRFQLPRGAYATVVLRALGQ